MKKELPEIELRRQLFHMVLGIVMVAALWKLDKQDAGVIFFAIALLGSLLSYVTYRRRIPFFSAMLETFDRPGDKKTLPGKGALFFFYGAAITTLAFGKESALAGITILALGDSVSHIVGRLYGRTATMLSRRKLLEGTLAGIVVGTLGASLFLPWQHALVAASAAMIAEAVELRLHGYTVDDNILVPVVAALVADVIRLW